MKKPCLDSNLHNYSGTSQQQRALAALVASSAQVDTRNIADLILFAKKYSAYLNYYNLSDTIAGDWQGFMSTDIAVSLATIASINTDDCFDYISNTLYPDIITPPSLSSSTPQYANQQQTFKFIFDLIASLAYMINQAYTTNSAFLTISANSDYQQFLNVSIGSKLALPLGLLNDYYVHYLTPNAAVFFPPSPFQDIEAPVDTVVYLSSLNFLTTSPWFYAAPANSNPLDTILGTATPTAQSIQQVITSGIFTGTVNDFLNGVAYIVNYTQTTELQKIISQYPYHSPHYALYLAFLQLFQNAQKHLNEYTGRHMKFYYEKVLQLEPNPGVPDDVYVAFTLQKNTPQHSLNQGTQLQAGKDANGNPLSYALTGNIVLNQASVSELKSLFLLKTGTLTGANSFTGGTETLHASPEANSADGVGGAITNPDGSWCPFGDLNNQVFNPLPPLPPNPPPAIGFAVASDVLYLNEGTRTVTIIFNCNSPLSIPNGTAFNTAFTIQFTGNKNWFNTSNYTATILSQGADSISNYRFTIIVNIDGNSPPIIPYSQKIHGDNWPQNLPMVQVLLTEMSNYYVLKSLVINSVEIDVTVNGVKNLVLQNCDGKIDTSKPFKPFGAFPDVNQGNSLIIGSKEIFQKSLNSLYVNFNDLYFPCAPASVNEILTIPLTPIYNNYYINLLTNILSNGIWEEVLHNPPPLSAVYTYSYTEAEDLTGTDTLIGSSVRDYIIRGGVPLVNVSSEFIKENTFIYDPTNTLNQTNQIFINVAIGISYIPEPDFTPNVPYSASSQNGFVQLQLTGPTTSYPKPVDLSLQTYLANNQPNPTVKTSTDSSGNITYSVSSSPPSPPPSPTVSSITINYSAQSMLSFSEMTPVEFANRSQFFYHIEPFGFREMHPFLLPKANEIPANDLDDQMNLLPVFNLDNGAISLDTGLARSPNNGGELWIGLTGAVPGETHSILFQVSEGSSNPLKDITTVNWYYLCSNNWILLTNGVVDYTNNLSQSSLVVITLPGDETLNNTRADSGLIWVKAVVQSNTDSVCKIISIVTNAAKAALVQNIPDNIQFSGNIAAGTISKLVTPDATIKQISQPYPSFGGTLPENNAMFDQRVSERLRHKNRAVTSWDYERFVLQKFPQIHKVKCINHTNLNTTTQTYSELKPGHVMLVTVPDLSQLTGANPYLPFTDLGLLEDIKKFIEPLTSPFVKLKVENPQFEGLQFNFNVCFKQGYDPTFYAGQLNTDIMNFLMPWASGSNTKDIEFGGIIEKSSVLNFVQMRSYVDYVTAFQMSQYIFEDGVFTSYPNLTNIEEAVATTARSILVPFYVPWNTPPLINTIIPIVNGTC